MAPKRRNDATSSSSSVPRFTSPENEAWYEQRKKWKIVVEKTVHPEIDALYRLSNAFDKLGWAVMLTLTGAYYPTLVREFYANIERKMDPFGDIVSTVKGTKITISKQRLCNLLHIPNVGRPVEMNSVVVITDPAYNEVDVMNEYGFGADLGARVLEAKERLIAYLLSFNILPRASDTHVLRRMDLYLMYKMINGLGQIEGIPLAPLIMTEMRGVVKTKRGDKNFIFPLLLTMIFRHFGVDLSNEEVEYTSESQVLRPHTMVALHFKKVGNEWVRKEENGDQEMGEAEAQPAGRPRRTMAQGIDYICDSMDRMHARMNVYEANQEDLRTRHTRMEEHLGNIDRRFGQFTQHYYGQYGYPPPDPQN
ncbi:unnamed protein product [Cuscuta epithymum]|uniref:Putative plant transposon protein domain-containing protein n=3 Tax=Cuscuta epithymum TaxID=186058 RepID=A0AAV0EJ13_9ASTE|nr:unnamed protein product [Cuscuta epithymum]